MSRYFAWLAERTGLAPPAQPATGAAPVADIAVEEILTTTEETPMPSAAGMRQAEQVPAALTPSAPSVAPVPATVVDKTPAPRTATAEPASRKASSASAPLIQRAPAKPARVSNQTEAGHRAPKTKTPSPALSAQAGHRAEALRPHFDAAVLSPAPPAASPEVFTEPFTVAPAAASPATASEQKPRVEFKPAHFEQEITESKPASPRSRGAASAPRPSPPRVVFTEQTASDPSIRSPARRPDERPQVEVKIGAIALQIHQAKPERPQPQPEPPAPVRREEGVAFRTSRYYWRGW